ncbi:MAG: hypothetical protein K2J55_01465, partial [Eubacterium sp.]|nr:hypothetical protein [Eubacterium sp.]
VYANASEIDEDDGTKYPGGSLNMSGGAIYNNTAVIGGDDIAAESSDELALASVGEGLTLDSTEQPITDWYYDGARFTGELDGDGNPIYDETRWAVIDEDGNPYRYTYKKPDNEVTVYLKAAHCIHTFGELITDIKPTCTEPGSGHGICSSCGDEAEETIEANGHSWDTDYTIDNEPTCTTEGSKSIHCQNCDEVKNRELIPVTEHIESDWSVDAEANCITEGSRHKKCETCGKLLKTEVIPLTEHHPSEDWKTDENEHWKVCTVCDEKLQRTSHTFGDLSIDKPPTCTEPGSSHRICSGCGYKEEETIETKGHSYGETMVKEATCEEDGYSYHTCTVCGYTETIEEFKATGHTFSDWEKLNETQHKLVCKCGEVEYQNHAWNAGEVTKAPTDKEEGEKTFTCTVCGETKTEAIPMITESDVNIDIDGDGKPNVNIDTDGDGKPDVNIDTTGDGKPDTNLINPTDTGSNDMLCLVFFTGIAMVAIVLIFVICKKTKKVSE